ncbi:hypothetical protein ACFL3Q_03515 [Planctomycetota bacterium]
MGVEKPSDDSPRKVRRPTKKRKTRKSSSRRKNPVTVDVKASGVVEPSKGNDPVSSKKHEAGPRSPQQGDTDSVTVISWAKSVPSYLNRTIPVVTAFSWKWAKEKGWPTLRKLWKKVRIRTPEICRDKVWPTTLRIISFGKKHGTKAANKAGKIAIATKEHSKEIAISAKDHGKEIAISAKTHGKRGTVTGSKRLHEALNSVRTYIKENPSKCKRAAVAVTILLIVVLGYSSISKRIESSRVAAEKTMITENLSVLKGIIESDIPEDEMLPRILNIVKSQSSAQRAALLARDMPKRVREVISAASACCDLIETSAITETNAAVAEDNCELMSQFMMLNINHIARLSNSNRKAIGDFIIAHMEHFDTNSVAFFCTQHSQLFGPVQARILVLNTLMHHEGASAFIIKNLETVKLIDFAKDLTAFATDDESFKVIESFYVNIYNSPQSNARRCALQSLYVINDYEIKGELVSVLQDASQDSDLRVRGTAEIILD